MKARLVLAALIIALATSAVDADYLGLTVESYVGEGWVENGFEGLTAWRIYAQFDDPIDSVNAVFGSPMDPLSMCSSDGLFRNDPLYNSTGPPQDLTFPPFNYWANQWDTYVTIGLDDVAGGEVFVPDDFGNYLVGDFTITNASYYVPTGVPHGHPVNGRVLLGQLVVAEGEHVSGILNFQDYNGVQWLDQPFQSSDPCPPDVNGDGTVDVLDLLAVLAAWGPCPGCGEDINGDEIVNVLDLLEILAAWGPCANDDGAR